MSRRPDGTTARTVIIAMRLTPTGGEMLDRLRGDLSRSAFMRQLLIDEAKRKQ